MIQFYNYNTADPNQVVLNQVSLFTVVTSSLDDEFFDSWITAVGDPLSKTCVMFMKDF